MLYLQKLRPSRAFFNVFIVASCLISHAAAIEIVPEEALHVVSKDVTNSERAASAAPTVPSDKALVALHELSSPNATLSKAVTPTLVVDNTVATTTKSSPTASLVAIDASSPPPTFVSIITSSSPNGTSTTSSASPTPSSTAGLTGSTPTHPDDGAKASVSSAASHLLRSAHAALLSPVADLYQGADASLAKVRVQRTTPRPRFRTAIPPRQLAQQASAPPIICRFEGACVPLSYCRLLVDLLDKSCLAGDRLHDLTCGFDNHEAMVCCPAGGFVSIFPPNTLAPPTYPPVRPTLPPPPPPPPPSPTPGPPPPPPPPSPFPAKCGIPQVFNWRADYRGLGSQPWVARVGFKSVETGAMQFPCCGSIISSQVVLTAAHCALAKTTGYKLVSIRAGEYDAGQEPDCTSSFCAHKVQDVLVSHVVVHPGYERMAFVNDVALLVLKTPLNFTLSTQPICLDGGNYSPVGPAGYVGTRAKLVGWGMTAGQKSVPDVQQQLDLPVVSVDECTLLYDQVVPITSQHMCVGGEPGNDACSGFGGAPLVTLDTATHAKYYQVAMMSFGSKQCGALGVPSVYTRIDKYFDWIRANMNYY